MSRSPLVQGPDPLGWFGDCDPDLLVVGHSHVGNVIEAMEQNLAPDARIAVTRPPNVGFPELNSAYWEMVTDSAPGRTVAIVWQGNEHNAKFLIQAEGFRVWDSLQESTILDALPGPWVTRTAVKNLFMPTFDGLAELIQCLRASARVVLVGTPPPKSEIQVRAGLDRESFFESRAAELGLQLQWDAATIPVAPEVLRVTLWRILQDIAKDIADNAGVEFVAAPSITISSEGLLKPEYAAADCTHANTAYGVHVLQSLHLLLKKTEGAP